MKTTGIDNHQYLSDATSVRLKKRGRLTKLFRILILVLTILVALLSFLSLALPSFRVREVVVEGASFYSEEEIISISEIRPGDPLPGIDSQRVMKNILAKCRYMKAISYSWHWSGRVVFTVEEEQCLMYTKRDGKYYSFSDSLKVIEESDEPFADFLYVELPYDVTLKAGQTIAFRDAAVFAKTTLVPFVKCLLDGPFAGQLTSVSLKGEQDLSFVLEGRCKVVFGEYKDLDQKELLLSEILKKKGKIPDHAITINLCDPQNPFESPGI